MKSVFVTEVKTIWVIEGGIIQEMTKGKVKTKTDGEEFSDVFRCWT